MKLYHFPEVCYFQVLTDSSWYFTILTRLIDKNIIHFTVCYFSHFPIKYHAINAIFSEGKHRSKKISSVQFTSVTQSCPTLCDPMNHSTPGLPVHHQLPQFTQIHVHRAGDAIQSSHPLSSPSPPDPNPSQHQNLFQ